MCTTTELLRRINAWRDLLTQIRQLFRTPPLDDETRLSILASIEHQITEQLKELELQLDHHE